MKTKHTVHILTLLFALGTVAFFVARPEAQTTEDPWEAWVDQQTDTVLKSAGDIDEAQRPEMRAKIREKFSALAAELKNEIALPPQTQDYAILQTVKQLRKAYDEGYNQKHKDTTVRVSYTVGDAEIFAYDESVPPLAEVDAKYPRDAWLQMLLDKGITIKNAEAYWEYLFLRDTLVHLERQPQVWTSGLFSIPATEDWETYKAAYIERELDQIQKRLREGQLARVFNIDEIVKEHHRHLGKDDAPGKVFRSLQSFPKEIPRVEFSKKSIIVVPQTVKALRDAYDEKYNERYAITSGSVSYTLDNGITFKYNVPLLMSEVDAKYPRDTWLQMLLDKRITIDNFEEYWAYLSKRDELVELEKQPEVWSAGLFGIAPTEDWETYKDAYLKQMLEKLHRRNGKAAVYFGKADAEEALIGAEEALKRSRELIENLEQSKPLLRDR
ncbi:hypothetical protein F4Z99_19020 [Candidatus Poribacteria bacterium]|nr:hypothetical protein [Candidatus Poribacteria bacterium]MYA99997.1 hypothetical protein [Candidatus Poribacteria bacterium]